MTSLRRASNGDWYSRKGIPADIRAAYKRAHGRSFEEVFRRPSSVSLNQAKQALREWDADVSGRIEALRAQTRGTGRSLSKREAAALCARWFDWFVARHEEDSETADGWQAIQGVLADALQPPVSVGGPHEEDNDQDFTPRQRDFARAFLSDTAEVSQFLLKEAVVLEDASRLLLLDTLLNDFMAALALLARRAQGDFSTSGAAPRPAPALKDDFVHHSGLTCWGLFEAWVGARKPAPATVNRWRSVFLALEVRFAGRDIATITANEAEIWAGTLTTSERSARVANDTWLRAARVIFSWARDKRKAITRNPFDGLRMDIPRQQKLREREFTDQESETILSATLQTPRGRMASHNAAARRWVPWICAYTGSRPGEVTQLRGEDVTLEDGIWRMRITPEAGTQKNNTARIVPLHEHLIEQGFGEFVKASARGPLFYDPTARRRIDRAVSDPGQSPAVKARNKLAAWVRELGITDQNISPQHAWRHTFKRKAARAGIERRFRFAFCGHASKEEGDSYEIPTLEDMATALALFPRFKFRIP